MGIAGASAAVLAALSAFGAPQAAAPELVLLGRIRQRMAEDLARLPNYTCLETIERSVRRAPDRELAFRDRVRLEIAFIGRKELFAWPESGRFEERLLTELITAGSFGTGNFGLHVHNVFLTSAPVFSYAGEQLRDGRRTHHYDFRFPLLSSAATVRVRQTEGRVGQCGSFWVDAETLDLLRLEVHADEIPPNLDCSRASDIMEYGRGPLGAGDFLLPRSAELIMADLAGTESRNLVRFSQCRQYATESSIRFEEAPGATAPARPSAEVKLPPYLELEMRLETPVDAETAAVGDPIRARLRREVKLPGGVSIAKGAIVYGRIRRLEQYFKPAQFMVGFEFFAAELGGGRAVFSAHLTGPRRVQAPGAWGPGLGRGAPVVTGLDIDESAPRPGIGAFLVLGSRLQLRPGLRMVWETR
ncbi:MAG: hypothetical protein AAB225_17265 [Acidobacteriota bacterium]